MICCGRPCSVASADLVEAWTKWEAAPGAPQTASRMEDEVQAFAAEIGMRPTRLRVELTELHRDGRSIEDCVRLVALEASIEAES